MALEGLYCHQQLQEFTFMLDTIQKYLKGLPKTGLQPEFNVYRGQSDSNWELRSSATRRLLDTQFDANLLPIDLISYHRDILIKARMEGFGIEQGRNLSDIQLLAELQHFGASTGLLDFSWNPLIAMWFASFDNSKHGKLFSINTNNPGYVYRLSEDEANQDISNIFSQQTTTRPSISFWEPTLRSEAKNRMLVQSSVFVIGPPKFTKNDDIVSEITIEQEDKEKLRRELDFININEKSLYKDIFGFAQTQGTVSKFTEHSIKFDHSDDSKFRQGIIYYQQCDFHSAVSIFDSLIESDSNKPDYYLYNGFANLYLEYYIQAFQNFDKYLSFKEQNQFLSYHGRSVANFYLGDLEEAIRDCDRAIEIKPNSGMVYFNRGASKILLNQYEDVISDNKKAISLEPFFIKPYYNSAYARYKLGQYDKSIEDYTTVLKYDPENFNEYYNRACAYFELEEYEYAVQDFTHAIKLNSEDAEAYYGRARAFYELRKYEHAVQNFTNTIELKSDFADAYYYRAYANKKLDRNESYEKDLEVAFRLNPQLAD